MSDLNPIGFLLCFIKNRVKLSCFPAPKTGSRQHHLCFPIRAWYFTEYDFADRDFICAYCFLPVKGYRCLSAPHCCQIFPRAVPFAARTGAANSLPFRFEFIIKKVSQNAVRPLIHSLSYDRWVFCPAHRIFPRPKRRAWL